MRKLFLIAMTGIACAVSADVVPGKTYRIVSAADAAKSLFVTNSSPANSTALVLWTDNDVPSQQWDVADNGDGTYSLRNVYTGGYAGRNTTAPSASSKLIQRTAFAAATSSWTLTPVDAANNAYRLTQKVSGGEFCATAASTADGTAVTLAAPSDAKAQQQTWRLVETEPTRGFDETVRQRIINGWKNHFARTVSGGQTFSYGGWGEAEMLETVLDAYETTGNSDYLTLFNNVFAYFKSNVGDNWLRLVYTDAYKWYGHDFNDDVMWMIIAAARAAIVAGNNTYLNLAKQNFDAIYARAYNQWGMMRWAEQSGSHNGTNSCINGPTEVAACYLAIATGDDSYYEKARELYANQRRYLFNAQTGQVFDSFTWDASTNKPGSYNRWVSTYNQGTMLGAAVMLYNRYGDDFYRADADRIVACTKSDLCDKDGIIKVCQVSDGDLCGFKGVLMRYLRRYVVDMGKDGDVAWLQANAMRAYCNMNSSDVAHSAWLTKSAENWKFGDTDYSSAAFGCSTAVSAAANAPLSASLLLKDAFTTIAAPDFDYVSGLSVAGTAGAGAYLTGARNGYYACYKHVDFGQRTAQGIRLSVSKARTASLGARLEVRLDSHDGPCVASVAIPTDGDWQSVSADIVPTTGIHDVYLVPTTATTSRLSAFSIRDFCFTTGLEALAANVINAGGTLAVSPVADNAAALADQTPTTAATVGARQLTVDYVSPTPVTPKGYALVASALDASADPSAWTLSASDDGQTWHELDACTGMTFASRCAAVRRAVGSAKPYTRFRLKVLANGGSATTSLGELMIFGTNAAPGVLTADGGSVQKGDAALTDGDATTVARFSADEPTEFVYVSKGRYALRRYALTSAAGSGAKAPASWSLYGSNNTSSWTLIDRRHAQLFPYGGSTQYYEVAGAEPYQNFRLVVDATGEATEAAALQLVGDVSASATLYDDILKNGGELTSSAGLTAGALRAVADNAVATSVRLPLGGGAWVAYHSTVPTALRQYSVSAGADRSLAPAKWTLQASNDGQSWVDVNTQSAVTFARNGQVRSVSVSPADKYSYFRLLVSAAQDATATEVEIGEWQVNGLAVAGADLLGGHGTSSAEWDGFSTGENYTSLFDGSADSKYCFDFYGSSWVDYSLDAPAAANVYSLTSASDEPTRDPSAWQLLGSDDGTSWTLLDERTDVKFQGRRTTQFFTFANEHPYAHYRLQLTANSGALIAQLAEWQMFWSANAVTGIGQVASGSEPAATVAYDHTADALSIGTEAAARVTVCSADGLTVASAAVPAGRSSLSLAGTPRGVYVVRVASAGKATALKIAK